MVIEDIKGQEEAPGTTLPALAPKVTLLKR
jgi:hypothetical protein